MRDTTALLRVNMRSRSVARIWVGNAPRYVIQEVMVCTCTWVDTVSDVRRVRSTYSDCLSLYILFFLIGQNWSLEKLWPDETISPLSSDSQALALSPNDNSIFVYMYPDIICVKFKFWLIHVYISSVITNRHYRLVWHYIHAIVTFRQWSQLSKPDRV